MPDPFSLLEIRWGAEVPVGLGVVGIAVVLPSGDFIDVGL
jgi:hypothetical protein